MATTNSTTFDNDWQNLLHSALQIGTNANMAQRQLDETAKSNRAIEATNKAKVGSELRRDYAAAALGIGNAAITAQNTQIDYDNAVNYMDRYNKDNASNQGNASIYIPADVAKHKATLLYGKPNQEGMNANIKTMQDNLVPWLKLITDYEK